MRIGIDAQLVPYEHRRGWGNYTYQLITNLLAIDHDNEFYFLYAFFKKASRRYLIPKHSNSYNRVYLIPGRVINFLWDKFNFPCVELLLRSRVDVFHHTCDFVYPVRYAAQVATIHDCAPLKIDTEIKNLFTKKFLKNIERIKKMNLKFIITDSENSRKDIVNFLGFSPERVIVIYPGVDYQLYRPLERETVDETIFKFGLKYKNYLLYVGAADEDKNLSRLVYVFHKMVQKRKIPDDFCLVFAGKIGWGYEKVQNYVKDIGISERCCFLGYVTSDDLVKVYNGAFAFVFPSLYEGFGLPVIESMACGTPVIASNTASLPEIGSDAALYFLPFDENEMEEKISLLLDDENLRRGLIDKGFKNIKRFDWKESAYRMLKIYMRCVNE